MVAAFDIHYDRKPIKGVAVLFDWSDKTPQQSISHYFDRVEEYESGAFFKRELPCIIKLLENLQLEQIDTIIVDGSVWVNDDKKKGLGAYVFDHLQGKIPVIGVSKNQLKDCNILCKPILRGKSQKHLWVSAIGLPLEQAAEKIKNMQGEFRIPEVLKKLDRLTRIA